MQIVPVSSNVSWASTDIIALYCTQYKALFGSVDLKMAMANKGAPHLHLCSPYSLRRTYVLQLQYDSEPF